MAKSTKQSQNKKKSNGGEMTAQTLAMLQQFTHHTMQQTLLETQQWQAEMAFKMAALQQFVDYSVSVGGTNFPSICKKLNQQQGKK